MPQRFICPTGHTWEADLSPGTKAVCPKCGAAGRAAPAEDESTFLITTSPLHSADAGVLPNLPEFELVGELGRGGMGIVYKAVELASGRVLAVKVIRKDRLQHDEAVRRFRREAQAAVRLNHPNIVRVFDSDHTGDTHYLAMEYVPGVTLERLVEQHGPVPYELACAFIRQAAHGLLHAHEQGLVHRDVKPSNLMISPPSGKKADGSAAELKILDMGVARVLQSENHPGEALSTLTQGGSVIGTADFVAPEQLEDPHGADIRSDLYSLGCTFHFLLVGDVPFPGGSLISKLDKQRWQMPPAVDTVRPDIPPGVAEVVKKLMAKKPAERYQTPAEVVAAFEVLERSGYLTSRPAAPRPRELRVLRGHMEAVQAVAVSPDAALAVSGSRDQTLRLWDLETGQTTRAFPRLPHEVRAVAFAPKGNLVAAAVGVSLRLWDVATGQEVRRLSGHSAAVRCLAFAPDGRWLISGGDDKTVRIWDVQLGREVQRLARHTASVTCLALTPDGDLLLSGGRDRTLRRWDLRSGQETGVLPAEGGPLLAVAVSADGRRAASAHFDTVLRLWTLPDGLAQGELHGHKQMVTGVGFLPDGSTLLSASQDQSVRWWDVVSGEARAVLEPHGAGINALAVAPAARLAVTAGADHTLRLLEIPA